MLRKLIRSKRALSPVISTVFLMAIIIAAIAVSLGIIYPQLNQLNDSIGIINAGTAMNSLDNDIKTLITNGEGGKISRNLEIGLTGTLRTDLISYSMIYLNFLSNGVTPINLASYNESQNRFIITQELEGDTIPVNSHYYLEGSDNQNYFFLNNTLQSSIPWAILNQSRGDTKEISTALSYRGLISTSKVLDNANSRIELTITIQMIEFDFPGNKIRSGSSPNISLKYHTLNTTRTGFFTIAGGNGNLFYLQIDTALSGNSIRTEIPLTHETPDVGSLLVRLEFITHQISVIF